MRWPSACAEALEEKNLLQGIKGEKQQQTMSPKDIATAEQIKNAMLGGTLATLVSSWWGRKDFGKNGRTSESKGVLLPWG